MVDLKIHGMAMPTAKSTEATTDRDLAAADEIGDRAGDEGADQGHDHHDHGHDGHGDGGFLDGLADVVLDDVQLVDVDHLVGHEHAEAAGERLVEVMRGGELRRAEGGEDVLGGAFVLRQEVCGLLLRDDDHGDHATEEHEHAGDGEAGIRFSMNNAPSMVPIGAPMVEPAP